MEEKILSTRKNGMAVLLIYLCASMGTLEEESYGGMELRNDGNEHKSIRPYYAGTLRTAITYASLTEGFLSNRLALRKK